MGLKDLVTNQVVTEEGWKYISSLAKTVVLRYYKYEDTTELEATLIEDSGRFLLTLEQNYDNQIFVPKNLRNVIFTRMRNTASNTMYYQRKLIATEDEVLDTNAYDAPLRVDFDYGFDSLEEARMLSLQMWHKYENLC